MIKDLPLDEITLRKYEKPYQLGKRELIRKICLSLGLLQAGDSRDVVVDILLVLLENKKEKREASLEEIKEKIISLREKNKLEIRGIADSNIRRQLKKLRDLMIIERISNNYRVNEFSSLKELFNIKIEKFLLPQIIERIKEYLDELEKNFS